MSPLGLKLGKGSKTPREPKAAKEPKPAKAPKEPKAKKVKASKDETARGVVVDKPKANIYTMMLVLSLVAILIGILALYLEMGSYNFELKGRV